MVVKGGGRGFGYGGGYVPCLIIKTFLNILLSTCLINLTNHHLM